MTFKTPEVSQRKHGRLELFLIHLISSHSLPLDLYDLAVILQLRIIIKLVEEYSWLKYTSLFWLCHVSCVNTFSLGTNCSAGTFQTSSRTRTRAFRSIETVLFMPSLDKESCWQPIRTFSSAAFLLRLARDRAMNEGAVWRGQAKALHHSVTPQQDMPNQSALGLLKKSPYLSRAILAQLVELYVIGKTGGKPEQGAPVREAINLSLLLSLTPEPDPPSSRPFPWASWDLICWPLAEIQLHHNTSKHMYTCVCIRCKKKKKREKNVV